MVLSGLYVKILLLCDFESLIKVFHIRSKQWFIRILRLLNLHSHKTWFIYLKVYDVIFVLISHYIYAKVIKINIPLIWHYFICEDLVVDIPLDRTEILDYLKVVKDMWSNMTLSTGIFLCSLLKNKTIFKKPTMTKNLEKVTE